MSRSSPGSLMLLACGLAACSGSRPTVSDAALQNRTYQAGWQRDRHACASGSGSERSAPEALLGDATFVVPDPIEVRDWTISSGGPMAATLGLERTMTLQLKTHSATDRGPVIPADPVLVIAPPTEGVDADGPRWNPLAVPALLVSLGAVAYGIFGTSELIIVLAVIAALMLASMAVRKGRMNEWSGKGIAIAALVIAALAGLITTIALLNGVL